MTAHHQTLLAKLAPKFGPQTENLAVDALGHILSGSKAARLALSKMIEAGGAVVGEIAQVRTQAAGKEGERPDLAGFDRDGRERVLIEAKFWAGATEMLAHLERQGLLASAPANSRKPSPRTYNEQWMLAKYDYRSPAQVRRDFDGLDAAA